MVNDKMTDKHGKAQLTMVKQNFNAFRPPLTSGVVQGRLFTHTRIHARMRAHTHIHTTRVGIARMQRTRDR